MILTDIQNRLVDALMALAPTHGFRSLSLRQLAKQAGLGLADAYAACPTKLSLINSYGLRMDAIILGGDDPETSADSQHDLLFDGAMRVFDAMLPDKAAIRRIHQDVRADPMLMLAGLPVVRRGISALMLAAGVEWVGYRYLTNRARLTHALYQVLKIWLAEDDPGQSRTMAELDRLLRQIDNGQTGHSGAQTN